MAPTSDTQPPVQLQTTLHNSSEISAPAGHYSHVAVHNGIAYISGQLPVGRDATLLSGKPFEEQADQVLANIDAALRTFGGDRRNLLQVRVYVTDINRWAQFDEIYHAWIGDHKPARAVAGVCALNFGSSIEIEAVASTS